MLICSVVALLSLLTLNNGSASSSCWSSPSGGFWPVGLIESLADHWRITDAIVSYLGKQLELLSSHDLAISTQHDKSGDPAAPDCPTTPSDELLV